jgi:hypothetical protein
LVLVGAASCGSGGSSTTERDAAPERGGETTTASNVVETLQRAVELSREGGTANYAGSFFFDAGTLGTDDPAEGSVSFVDEAAAYTVDMQNETTGLVPEGTPPEDVRLQVREVDDRMFLYFPAAFASAGVGESWVEVSPAAPPTGTQLPEQFAEVSARPFLAARLLRPEMCLDLLATARNARLVGPEKVRSKETTRYAFDWAPLEWVEDAGLFFFFGADRSPQRLATLERVLDDATIADVWLDDLGRVRRLTATADLTLIAPYFDPPGDPEMWRELRTQCEFFDYGARVPTVSVPEAVVSAGPGV